MIFRTDDRAQLIKTADEVVWKVQHGGPLPGPDGTMS